MELCFNCLNDKKIHSLAFLAEELLRKKKIKNATEKGKKKGKELGAMTEEE